MDAVETAAASTNTASRDSVSRTGRLASEEQAYAIAEFMGAEFKKKGGKLRACSRQVRILFSTVHVALGPVVGPLGRVALGGRNWEGFGADRKYSFRY
jgi:beta-glucosidase